MSDDEADVLRQVWAACASMFRFVFERGISDDAMDWIERDGVPDGFGKRAKELLKAHEDGRKG